MQKQNTFIPPSNQGFHPTARVRFWNKVFKTDTCWIWTGDKNTAGYGLMRVGGKSRKRIRAHRFSWIIHNGNIPAGLFVLHHCDNPSCVNPSHLFIGTGADNMRDMATKGRSGGHPPMGNRNAQKVNKNTAKAIRVLYSNTTMSQQDLADFFGLGQGTIWRIVRRKIHYFI